ncbi:MAG: glycolate oxidase subunit GlcF [Alphaproteobacteria bacterium]
MQTRFTAEQMADPDLAEANRILRACVHCGFCIATCPTYVLLGDELDSPRGRIYLIKDMLETGRRATEKVVRHVDRCLSCLSCMTTCPSGVNYMHLVDQARGHIEATYRRPLGDRFLRALLGAVLPHPKRLRWAMLAARLARPAAGLLPARLKAMIRLTPRRAVAARMNASVFPALGVQRKRVALLAGCVQQDIEPAINAASLRLLARSGCEVVVARGAGCCGALKHHLGKTADAEVKANIAAWCAEADGAGLDAIVTNASGCGTMVKDYGYMLRNDPVWSARAARISALARDISEIVSELGLKDVRPRGVSVAYHAACSLQHGQRVRIEPKALLAKAGFAVCEPRESHLCCGSAGSYNMLQPELASRLAARKSGHLAETGAAVVATGNIGCMVQLRQSGAQPVVHTVELLDWATGGPRPEALGPLTQA